MMYLPGFCPEAFERIQRTELAPVVPLITIIQLSASAGWLYVSCANKNGDNNHKYAQTNSSNIGGNLAAI